MSDDPQWGSYPRYEKPMKAPLPEPTPAQEASHNALLTKCERVWMQEIADPLGMVRLLHAHLARVEVNREWHWADVDEKLARIKSKFRETLKEIDPKVAAKDYHVRWMVAWFLPIHDGKPGLHWLEDRAKTLDASAERL